MSTAARGDRMPCTRTGCAGVMQFGREPGRDGAPAGDNTGITGWNCSATPAHFTTGAGDSGAKTSR